jgi:hypothetical protein
MPYRMALIKRKLIASQLSAQALLFQVVFDFFGKAKVEKSRCRQRRGHIHRHANLIFQDVLDSFT